MDVVRAELSAVVWKVVAAVGDRVREGDELMILESMKMEIPVEAAGDGTVARIDVAEGDAVSEGQTLVVLEA